MTTVQSPKTTLKEELASLDGTLRDKLRRAGFDEARLLTLAATLQDGNAEERRDKRNRIPGEVKKPDDASILSPDPGKAELGHQAIERGELAFAVLAGGMATRMGGVVKALVEAIPGHTFLDLRLRENRVLSDRSKKHVPLWLMTGEQTDGPTRQALEAASAPAWVKTFTQDLGVRLTPGGHLFRGDDGQPSLYSPGHGDFVDAVRRSGLLKEFIANGGKYVWIANLDNLGAVVDEAILGTFIASKSDVMVEVAEKEEGDRGGIPVHAQGKLQVLEEFRLPRTFDAASVRVFNTNTFLVRAEALASVNVDWNWFEVEKKVDGKTAVQFERLLQELTGALPASYIRVPREGSGSRFLPAKDYDELARRRSTIAEVARVRGILGAT
jgi:UTP--glucose-1-phosphate uridylyltransferase